MKKRNIAGAAVTGVLAVVLLSLVIARKNLTSMPDVYATAPPPAAATTAPSPASEMTPVPAAAESPAEATPEPSPTPYVPETLEPCSELLRFDDPETGDWLDYWCFIPEGATVDYPVIVSLHGDGYLDRAEALMNCGIIYNARALYGNAYPFILLVPCTRVASWVDGTIPDTLMDLISDFREQQGLKLEKVALTGHSRGAIAVWYLASLYPDRFSCAVPVSCCNDRVLDLEALAKVPLRAFVSDADNDFGRYGEDMQQLVYLINNAGGNADFRVIMDCYHGDMEYAPYGHETFEWMVANTTAADAVE